MRSALADGDAFQQPYPRKSWTRAAEAAVLAWAGDDNHDLALDRRAWARRAWPASRDQFMEWCNHTFSKPTLTWRAIVKAARTELAMRPRHPCLPLVKERMPRFQRSDGRPPVKSLAHRGSASHHRRPARPAPLNFIILASPMRLKTNSTS